MSESSADLSQFIGHFHPILVHLPIGFLVMAFLLEAASLRPAWKHLRSVNGPILWITVPTAIATAVCGWLLSGNNEYDPDLLRWHRLCGITIATLVPVVAVLHGLGKFTAYRVGLVAILGLVGITGHFGGALTHGREFLFKHAPPLLRRLLGQPTNGPETPRPPSSQSLDAPIYETAIEPIFSTYCTSCHGKDKAKAGLRLHTFANIEKGGDDGPAFVPGKSAESLLMQRIQLPATHDDHMPPEGKRQPTPDQVALLAWWIDSGAPTNRSARELNAPAAIQKTVTGQ